MLAVTRFKRITISGGVLAGAKKAYHAVVDDERLAQRFGELGRELSRYCINATARGERHDDAYGFGGVLLSLRGNARCRQHRACDEQWRPNYNHAVTICFY